MVKVRQWLPRKARPLDPENARLLANVLSQPPEDDGPRLVYADWLMERNDPRGELISLQCRLAKMGRADPERDALSTRAKEIETENADEWRRAFGWPERATTLPRYTRGFIEEIDADAEVLMPIAGALFEREPVRKLRLRALKPAALVKEFLAFEGFRRLEELDFQGQNSFSGKTIGEIVSSPNLRNLIRLCLNTCRFGPAGAKAIAEKLDLPRLVRLELSRNKIGDKGVGALAARKTLPPELFLNGEGITATGVEALAASPALETVRVLSLEWNHLGDEGVAALLGSRHAGSLAELRIGSGDIGPAGVAALAATTSLPGLKRLSLSGNQDIGAKGVEALAAGGLLGRLEALEIDFCGIGEAGANAFLAANLPALTSLTVGHDAGKGFVRALLASPLLPRLRTLRWQGDASGIAEWGQLLQKPSPFAGPASGLSISGVEGTYEQLASWLAELAKPA